jgi:hypothetical protein
MEEPATASSIPHRAFSEKTAGARGPRCRRNYDQSKRRSCYADSSAFSRPVVQATIIDAPAQRPSASIARAVTMWRPGP